MKIAVDKTLIVAGNPFTVATQPDGTVELAIRAEGVAVVVKLEPREATVYGTGLIQCAAIASAIVQGRTVDGQPLAPRPGSDG